MVLIASLSTSVKGMIAMCRRVGYNWGRVVWRGGRCERTEKFITQLTFLRNVEVGLANGG